MRKNRRFLPLKVFKDVQKKETLSTPNQPVLSCAIVFVVRGKVNLRRLQKRNFGGERIVREEKENSKKKC